MLSTVSLGYADTFIDALKGGEPYVDMRLRYEAVEQDNSLKDADALTLRTRFGYKTGVLNGFSALIELEDSRQVGIDDYNGAGIDGDPSYSVIADPESTEVDQGYIAYKTQQTMTKLGRQVITLDNHRFVGHVGWRQDRQTFDGLTFAFTPLDKLAINYAYIDKRNRIFSDERDIDAKDNLLNVSYKTPIGKVTGYAYLLEVDNTTDNSIDTYGIRLSGAKDVGDIKVLYTAEYADQENETALATFDTDYSLLEAGLAVNGITAKVGYEILGSDNSVSGFTTPLATGHKFNGWADQFLSTPTQGLKDAYVSLSGKVMGGKLAVIYHDFEADDSTATVDDLGDELDIVYARKFGKNYNAGIKYANYDAGDAAAGKVDTEKLWIWAGLSF
jgi:hypothetical protein